MEKPRKSLSTKAAVSLIGGPQFQQESLNLSKFKSVDATEEAEEDALDAHHIRLAKAIHDKKQDEKEGHAAAGNVKRAKLMTRKLKDKMSHAFHTFGEHDDLQKFESQLKQGTAERKRSKPKQAHARHYEKGVHLRTRHRITKKRFMVRVDAKLLKAALDYAKLDNSPLWEDNFNARELSVEKFIACKRDLIKMEVIIEALKEGVFDKVDAPEEIRPGKFPTEQELADFERMRDERRNIKKEEDEDEVLQFTKVRAKELVNKLKDRVKGQVARKDLEKTVDEAKDLLIEKERIRALVGDDGHDAFAQIVKNILRETHGREEWSVSDSTTTGSYKSWRREPLHHLKKIKEKPKHWTDKTHHPWMNLFASIIIFGVWVHYLNEALDEIYYDTYSEALHINKVWSLRKIRKSRSWDFLLIHVYDWFHCVFTWIAPMIVYKGNGSLGVFYGFSILIKGFIEMFAAGQDLVYQSAGLTWETYITLAAHAAFKSFLFVFFLIYHYVVDDSVKQMRESRHRKDIRLNKILNAKNLGEMEQRIFAWNWMINHAKSKELQKLSKVYPEIKKKHGRYPLPDREDIQFDLRRELKIFRNRHRFHDVPLKGGFVKLDKYDDGLFGTEDSHDDYDEIEILKQKKAAKIAEDAKKRKRLPSVFLRTTRTNNSVLGKSKSNVPKSDKKRSAQQGRLSEERERQYLLHNITARHSSVWSGQSGLLGLGNASGIEIDGPTLIHPSTKKRKSKEKDKNKRDKQGNKK